MSQSETERIATDGPTRVGVVGLGNIGRFHANNLDTIAEDHPVELVGGLDIDEGARNRFESQFGVPTYEDTDTLFGDIDALVVTTPNRFHETYAVKALEAGIHVLVEKPMAHTLESAKRMAAAASESGAICMVGFHSRFTESVRVLRNYIEEGRFGDVHHIEANFVRRRGIPGRGSWFTRRETAGGGALIDIGAHAVDLSLHLLDFPAVQEVSGVARSLFGPRDDYAYLDMWGSDLGGGFDVEDSVSAFVRCGGQRTFSLEVAWAANRPTTNQFVVRGDGAGATLNAETGDLTIHEVSGAGTDHFADTDVTTRSAEPHLAEQRFFVEAIRSGRTPELNTPDQALSVQRVIDAIYRSSEDGGAVSVDDTAVQADH